MEGDTEPSLRDVLEAVNARFDAVDDRLAALSETSAWAKMNIGMLAHALAGIQAGVDQCRQDLARRDHRLSTVETRLAQISEDLDIPETPKT